MARLRKLIPALTLVLGTGLFVAAIITAGRLPGGLELSLTPVIRGKAGGHPVVVVPLAAGERFTLHYYHSVENAPIWEVHSLDAQGKLYIEEERYLKFGAGMGRMPGVGRMVRRGPYEVIEDMHMPTGDFVLRVGSPGVDHTLIWRGKSLNLSARWPHQAVQFKGRPINRLQMLWRRFNPYPAVFAQESP